MFLNKSHSLKKNCKINNIQMYIDHGTKVKFYYEKILKVNFTVKIKFYLY